MHDVVVIGGGVIGLSIAYESSRRGLSVLVLEQGQFGREASWAGAGILTPGHPELPESPMARLAAAATELWPRWSADLRESTGIDNGFRRCGGICFPEEAGGETGPEVAAWRSAGVDVQPLSEGALHRYEPQVAEKWSRNSYRLPGLAQVRNPRHLKALVGACSRRGVELRCGHPVIEWTEDQGRVISAVTPTDRFCGGAFVVASGAWSRQVLAGCGEQVAVEPVRGQIVLLSADRPPFGHVLECGRRYLVPRPDGRILIGSTEERVGFEKANTAEGVAGLIAFGTSLVPSLASARYEQAWSGLRPFAARGTPYLGKLASRENLYVATGHFRSGLNLSPITAVVVADLLTGRSPAVPVDAFGAC